MSTSRIKLVAQRTHAPSDEEKKSNKLNSHTTQPHTMLRAKRYAKLAAVLLLLPLSAATPVSNTMDPAGATGYVETCAG